MSLLHWFYIYCSVVILAGAAGAIVAAFDFVFESGVVAKLPKMTFWERLGGFAFAGVIGCVLLSLGFELLISQLLPSN
jgi:hypothetical protein